jgi:WG containing repeat
MVDYAKVEDFSCGLAAFQEKSGGLWGFLDAALHLVVPPKYEEVCDFSEGFAVVKRGDAYGFINLQGEEVIAPKYSYASSFEAGFALVRKNGMKFYIDGNGVEYCCG